MARRLTGPCNGWGADPRRVQASSRDVIFHVAVQDRGFEFGRRDPENRLLDLIYLTNTGSDISQVNVFAALLSGGTCGGTNNVEAATNPFLILRVQTGSTLAVLLPTPLAFTPATGYDNLPHTCVAASMPITGGSVYVGINGFMNWSRVPSC